MGEQALTVLQGKDRGRGPQRELALNLWSRQALPGNFN